MRNAARSVVLCQDHLVSRREEITRQDRLLQVAFGILMLLALVLLWFDGVAYGLGWLCMLGAGVCAFIGFHKHGFRQ